MKKKKHGQQQLSFATFTSYAPDSLGDLITNNPEQKGVKQDRRAVKKNPFQFSFPFCFPPLTGS